MLDMMYEKNSNGKRRRDIFTVLSFIYFYDAGVGNISLCGNTETGGSS